MEDWFEGEVDDGDIQGHIHIVNTSDRPCYLTGQPQVRLQHDGEVVRLGSGYTANDEAAQRVVAMPPSGTARLRIDWSPPFCHGTPRTQRLTVTLPDQAGELTVDVADPATPGCLQGETNETLRSHLSAGAFDHTPHAQRPPRPDHADLTATIDSIERQDQARVTYKVHLHNPTDEPIDLTDDCPVYAQDVLISGTNGAPGHSDWDTYWLNCAAVPTIEPDQTATFAMQIQLPPDPPGPEIVIGWRILHPGILGEDGPRDGVRTDL